MLGRSISKYVLSERQPSPWELCCAPPAAWAPVGSAYKSETAPTAPEITLVRIDKSWIIEPTVTKVALVCQSPLRPPRGRSPSI